MVFLTSSQFFLKPSFRLTTVKQKVPVIMHQTLLANWHLETFGSTTRKVEKVELCSGVTSGKDEWEGDIGNFERHYFLRAYLESTPHRPQEIVLFERVKAIEGLYHTVIPLRDIWPPSGTFLHPQVIDVASTIEQGSSNDIVRELKVERVIQFKFEDRSLTVEELATIFEVVGVTTGIARLEALSCRNMSGFFAFMCVAALVPGPILPPFKRRTGRYWVRVIVDEDFLEEESRSLLDQLLRTRDSELDAKDDSASAETDRPASGSDVVWPEVEMSTSWWN